MNQRPSGLSHKALPCLPLENIVALLAWSASQFSLFSHLSTTPVSATGGGVPLRPNERSSSRHNPERKKSRSLDLLLYGHRVYGGSESNTRKHIENSTFLRHRRTGLLRKSNPPLYRTGEDLLIGHTVLGNSPNTS